MIEGGGKLYLSPSVASFRARLVAPHGGQGHFVVGPYSGELEPGERVLVRDRDGVVRARRSL